MTIKGAIFDLDGTLLDSMLIWDNAGEQYLRSLGIVPENDIKTTLKNMSMIQGAKYMQKTYHLNKSCEEIIAGVNAVVEHFYMEEVQPKTGVKEFLQRLAKDGVRMCIATATDKYLVASALKRLEMEQYFEKLFTCSEVGHGKDEPHIYETALRYLGTTKENTLVFEDAAYAIETAKTAGFVVAAVYDISEEKQKRVQELSDYYIADFGKLENFSL